MLSGVNHSKEGVSGLWMESGWAFLSARLVWFEISIGARGQMRHMSFLIQLTRCGAKRKRRAGSLKAVRVLTPTLESFSSCIHKVEHLFVHLFAIHISSLMKSLFRLFAHLLICVVF